MTKARPTEDARPDAMTQPDAVEITELVEKWRAGDADAGEELLRRTYDQLHRIARGCFRKERSDHTLQATALVHEAYMAITGAHKVRLESRAQFLGFMAHVMRRVLIDHARRHGRLRRGGGQQKITLIEAREVLSSNVPADLVALDDALTALAAIDRRKALIVEMRFFAGLTLEEVAEALEISRSTAVREWQRARAWLYRELRPESAREA